ncbi:MAG: hypothetical protein ACK5M5_03735 [Limnobaculum xujianqingii]
MKHQYLALSLALATFSFPALAATNLCDSSYRDALPKYEYQLKKTFEVDGRQGITTDGKFYYVSGSTTLSKYDMQGNLISSNKTPFDGYKIPANHIGDIDVYNNEIYVSSEWFMDGVGKDIQIAVHDADTLKLKRTFPFNPDSGQQEVSAITVDKVNNSIWMASWVGEESGRYLYEYDLANGQYKRKVHLQPVPQWIQGIVAYQGDIYLTADDGTADDKEVDNLYRVKIDSNKSNAPVVLERAFTDFKDYGEIEGVAVNPQTHELLVHSNRGKQIVLGMPKGFYPGYDREISEVYVYGMEPVCKAK